MPDAVLPGLPVTPDPGAVAVGQVVGAHALRGWVRVKAYQPQAPSLAPGRRVLLERGGEWRETTVWHAGGHGRGLVLLCLEAATGTRPRRSGVQGCRFVVLTRRRSTTTTITTRCSGSPRDDGWNGSAPSRTP